MMTPEPPIVSNRRWGLALLILVAWIVTTEGDRRSKRTVNGSVHVSANATAGTRTRARTSARGNISAMIHQWPESPCRPRRPGSAPASGEGLDHAPGEEVDLAGVVGDGPEHEVLEPGVDQVLDAGVDAVDGAHHVALLQVLPRPVGAHGAQEGRPGLRDGSLVASLLDQMDEVAVAERERLQVAAATPRVLLQLQPVALDPLLRARTARQPVARLHDAVHDRGGDHGDVVLVGVGHPRSARDPHRRQLRRPGVDGDVLEAIVAAL